MIPQPRSGSKLVVAQVYLLLGTIKYDKDDPRKWDAQVESLRKLIDENGMDVYTRYFTRLVVANAGQIFPSFSNGSRASSSAGNVHILVAELRKLSTDFGQARKIAESIESGTEDLFRDFELSSFMEHFKLDGLEKTLLALAFKLGPRSDLQTKADAILSTNFPIFVNILSRPPGSEHGDLPADFVAELLDRFIQVHPPNFTAAAKRELEHKVLLRYQQMSDTKPPPAQVLASLDLLRVLAERQSNALALYIHKTGPEFTADDETCYAYLQSRPGNIQLSEEQVSVALTYTTISQTPRHNPSVLVAALLRVLPTTFRWQETVQYFDHSGARVTSEQFLRLYKALLPIARQGDGELGFDIQRLWGGEWENPETQLSFISAFASLKPEQIDATTIPGLKATISSEDYGQSLPSVRESAAYAVRHPLVSEAALSAVFNVALHSMHASQSTEAKRLFQDVVVPNLAIFVVSAFGVPKPWPPMADDTLISLFEGFLGPSADSDFVLDSLWRKDTEWVKQRLVDFHAAKPMILPLILDHAVRQNWVDVLVYSPTGFGLDMAAYAHAEGHLDLQEWARRNADRSHEVAMALLRFLNIKASREMTFQRPPEGQPPVKETTTLQVRTVSALLQILEEFLPKNPLPDMIVIQRQCITAYPRLINYGEGFDDIIDENGKDGNALPPAANVRMEEHYKKMYSDEIPVKDIVQILQQYKHSRVPLEQDVFACMIHGLFDEYSHYIDYPLEALATTAVLFGGIISHRLVSDLPLQIGLGMVLEAVRDHSPEEPMYKFGLQALMQLFGRLREWPGFCTQLLQIPALQSTEAWRKAEEVVRAHEEELARNHGGSGNNSHAGPDGAVNGTMDESLVPEQRAPPFMAISVDLPAGGVFEDPSADAQGKIQFYLNNLTDTTLQAMSRELRELLDQKHQQWFASHLVEERARMQPNYHQVYLNLVEQFKDKALWSEVLRETYVSVARMLNSDVTMQTSMERNFLKNLGCWLGLLTLARDKPIRHKNIAFKQLLIEAHDTKRLTVVIPFVCKVLIQGAHSNVFRPPNPWLMDIIHLLIELYHNAELKLNLKFEIEVLCKDLSLDHKNIQPSGEILNRVPADVNDLAVQDTLGNFESLSVNGMGARLGSGPSPEAIPLPPIPDLGPSLVIPQTEVVPPSRLQEIVHTALTRALQDIIQPVVDRSVTIAAISTREMIRKDFITEPDDERVRSSAISMVKTTAGSLAQVTSKEPLRANFTNYMRTLSNDCPQPLPEGIIIMCVNSNLELASSVIEKAAEERAVPEIEEMLRVDLEARRQHRALRPNESFVDVTGLNRWSLTMPSPYKLSPNSNGLNPEQMAIYGEFARQATRAPTAAPTASHVQSNSNATNSLANEVLQDPYSSVANIATPAETATGPSMNPASQLQAYPQAHAGAVSNGRQANAGQVDVRLMVDRMGKLLEELQRSARSAHEEHFRDLPRQHSVLDLIDAATQLVIKTQQHAPEFPMYAANQIASMLFNQSDNTLASESLVHVLQTLRRIAGVTGSQAIRNMFHQHPGQAFLHIPLISALINTDLLDWINIDLAMAKALQARKEGSIEFLGQVMDLTLLNDSPVALYTDFVRSLEEAWQWIIEEPEVTGGRQFKAKILAPPPPLPANVTAEAAEATRHEQMEYVFDEWTHLCHHPHASDNMLKIFVQQMHSRRVVTCKDDFLLFMRQALDRAVDRYETNLLANGTARTGYMAVDALAKMVLLYLLSHEDGLAASSRRADFFDSVLGLATLVLNHHHVNRGENFKQRVFFRLFSVLLHQIHAASEQFTDTDHDSLFLKFTVCFQQLSPNLFPGFVFAWVDLLAHRIFLPTVLGLPDEAGWPGYARLICQLLSYLGDLVKPIQVSPVAKEAYAATLKLLAILQHDFPDFVIANHMKFCGSLPPHTTQLVNMILVANPTSFNKMPDPLEPSLKVDRMADMRETPAMAHNPAALLGQMGLLEVLDQCLQNGPSEDAIAQISHAFSKRDANDSCYGHVPVAVNRRVVDAVVMYIGASVLSGIGSAVDATVFVPGSSDVRTMHMLVNELGPEMRYFVLSAIVNQLRFANAHTHYFSHLLLDLFGLDMSDPEETEIRQQIVRILLERLVGYWPQPWGLMITVIELMKNEKYMFFELPYIKSAPEVAERFAALLNSRT